MDSSTPLISVGLPVYNGEKYLEYAVKSILAQTYANYELIISDNASTDSTEDICMKFAAADRRVKYFRNETNIGASGNFKRVFELSSGKYFKWTGYDDVSEPGLLEQLVNILEKNEDYILCYSRTTRIDENGEVITHNYSDGLTLSENKGNERLRSFFRRFRTNTYCEPAFGLIRREILEQTKLIDCYISSDEIMLGELAMRGKFVEAPESKFFRRIHPDGAGHKHNTLKALSEWYSPGNNKFRMRRWKMLAGYINAVSRVQISAAEKFDCYWQVFKWAMRHWRGLSFDIVLYVRNLFG